MSTVVDIRGLKVKRKLSVKDANRKVDSGLNSILLEVSSSFCTNTLACTCVIYNLGSLMQFEMQHVLVFHFGFTLPACEVFFNVRKRKVRCKCNENDLKEPDETGSGLHSGQFR